MKASSFLKTMETKEITDPASIFKMIETLFKQFPVYIIFDKKPKQVKIVGIKSPVILIQSPDENPNPAERFLLLTNAGNLLNFKFKVNAKDPRGIELLTPISLSINTATRTNSRYQSTEETIYISNIISQVMVIQDLTMDALKVENILKPYIQKLKTKFSEAEFFLCERMDARARLMSDVSKHIFVPDMKSPDSIKEEFVAYGDYLPVSKSGKKTSGFLSEICVPLQYKNIILFGYLQILNEEKTNINDYNLVLHATNKITKDLIDSNIFNESKFKATIIDIGSTGLSFSHPQSKYFGKIFSLGGTILFDLYDTDKNLGTFRAVVRNIKPLEKLFRIGCQFFHVSDEYKIIEELIKKNNLAKE